MKNLFKLAFLVLSIAVTAVACDPAKQTNDSESTKPDSTEVTTDSTKKDTNTVVVDSLKKDSVKK